jgi:hypothetical protein
MIKKFSRRSSEINDNLLPKKNIKMKKMKKKIMRQRVDI